MYRKKVGDKTEQWGTLLFNDLKYEQWPPSTAVKERQKKIRKKAKEMNIYKRGSLEIKVLSQTLRKEF